MKTVVRYRTDKGVFTALIGDPGTKYLPVVYIDAPIRLMKVPQTEERYMTIIDYPPKKAARRMLKAGRHLGITKTAKRFLQEA